MRVTLDWDTAEDQQENLDSARNAADRAGLPWELRRSSGGSGWHFVAYQMTDDTPTGLRNSTNLRETWGDDMKRLRLDKKRYGEGSPFYQVLYRRKYMERSEWPDEQAGYSTGNVGRVVEQSEGVKAAPEKERIKTDSGSLDYVKIFKVLLGRESIAEIADRFGRSKRQIYRYRNDPSILSGLKSAERPKKRLKRWARSQGIGHYSKTESGGEAADEVRYVDREDERRLLVEYIDVPWDHNIGEDDREYTLLNTHTGTYNQNHGEQQLRHIHDEITDRAMECLSPENPTTGTKLNLQEQNTNFAGESGWSREFDSINREQEILDENEADVYLDNLPNSPIRMPVATYSPSEQPLWEVCLWDDSAAGSTPALIWHVIGVWAGESLSECVILKDNQGWW